MCGCIAFLGFVITYFFVHHPKYSPKPIFESNTAIPNEVIKIKTKDLVNKLNIEMTVFPAESTPFLCIF